MQELHKTIGIMGGTFDPVHYGHLIVADAVREGFGLDKVIFIPSGQPPHKDNSKVSGAEHRYSMLKAAVESNPCFDVSRLEIERQGYTYSVDTLTDLKKIFGEAVKINFIIGADIVPELVTWKDFERVFTMCEFIAVFRPGYDRTSFLTEIERLKCEYLAKIHTIEVPLIEISSSDIRERAALGRAIRYLVPEVVASYININKIYNK